MTTKVYTALSTLPKVKIGNCSAMLENHLQCWRAADYQIKETTVQPAVPATKTSSAVEEMVAHRTYQMCRRHAQADKAEYDVAQPAPAA